MRTVTKILKLTLILLSILWINTSAAQLSVASNTVTINNYADLTNFTLRNAGSAVDVNIRIELTEANGAGVLAVHVPLTSLPSGNTLFSSVSANAVLSFYENPVSNYLRNNDQLPEGKYRVCYEVVVLKGTGGDTKLCLDFSISNGSPVLLINPADESNICDERPTFQWVNPSPFPAGAKVRFVLSEIKAGQTGTEAIYRNVPVVNLNDVGTATILPLPSFIEQLQENASYAWQVIIYDNNGVIQKSEVWTFKKSCGNEKAIQTETAYPQLTKQEEVSIYIVKDVIRFSFVNSYGTEKLDYSIIDAQTNKAIKYYPEVRIHTGVNNVSIDVDDCNGLKKGKFYIIKVTNVQSLPLQMKFRYDD